MRTARPPHPPAPLSPPSSIMPLEVKGMDYDLIREKLEEAYRRTPDAQAFLQEILVLWSEYRVMEGEWSCALAKAG